MNPLHLIGDDMFVVVTYDVHATRCARVMKYLRRWLEHRQRSVFSGFLTQKQVESMRFGLMKLLHPTYDSVIIFQSNKANQFTEWSTSCAADARATSMIVLDPSNPQTKVKTRSVAKVIDPNEKAKPRFRM